jgi:hypothetical protein
MEANMEIFELDLAAFVWRRRAHGDMSLFPVSTEDYYRHRCPRYGIDNPERVDNPFWVEMVRRRWPPKRARFHFGDRPAANQSIEKTDVDGETTCEKLLPERAVWTALREGHAELTLADGRKLVIGGEVQHHLALERYGEEAEDDWNYSDVIVSDGAGGIGIYIYPLEVFPPLMFLEARVYASKVYITGFADYRLLPEQLGRMQVLRLDLENMAITKLEFPKPHLDLRPLHVRCEGEKLIFQTVKDREEDPERLLALDLSTLDWSELPQNKHKT